MKTNRKYKDSIFVKLFKDTDKLLELYNAIEGTNYKDDTEIVICTLEDAIYAVRKNDLAFQLDSKFIILFEHQSTISKNMPLRMFLYLAREYERIISNKAIYQRNRIPLPTPQLIVLYNGKEPYPKETILKLSDSYMELGKEIGVEVKVKIININYDEKDSILNLSPTLKGYSYFIDKVRRYIERGMNRDQAIKKGIKDCIEANILKDFLEENSSEVYNMLFEEFKLEEAIRYNREEAREEGIEIGMKIAGVKAQIDYIQYMKSDGLSSKEIAKLLRIELDMVEMIVILLEKYPHRPSDEIVKILLSRI